MDCRFSVIVPVYKVEKYLNQCIDSILSQSYPYLELIAVVDVSSGDNCERIVDEYCKNDDRVKKILREHNGLGDARNVGLEVAVGKYIIFVDSDDYIDSASYFKDMNNCIERFNPDYIITGYKKYDETSRKVKIAFQEEMYNSLVDRKDIVNILDTGNFNISAWSKCVKKELIDNIRLRFARGYGEDIEWTGKLLNFAKKISVIDSCGYVYRMRNNSLSKTNSLQCVIDTKNRIQGWEDSIGLDDEYGNSQRGIMSYFYFINIAYVRNLTKPDKKVAYDELKNLRYLENYARSKKTKLAKMIVKILGYRLGGNVLNFYIYLGSH